MRVIVDRFEGDLARVELDEGIFYDIPKVLVPDAKEGDVIDIIVNHEETDKLKSEVDSLIDELFM